MTEQLAIAIVESETGVTKDTLRMWERRYGFPAPMRDALGNRLYTLEQVERLREIKRLIDSGFRPSKVINNQKQVAAIVADQRRRNNFPESDPRISLLLEHLTNHAHRKFKAALAQMQLTLGLRRFVLEVVRPLNVAVGKRWACGDLELHIEHLYTESIHRQLYAALATHHTQEHPSVLLTTLPGETHNTGLLMAQCMLALESAEGITLGVQTPIDSIVQAAKDHRADIVALSVSGAYNAAKLLKSVTALRQRLDRSIPLWLGGAGIRKIGQPDKHKDVLLLENLEQIEHAVAAWRTSHSGAAHASAKH